MKRKMIELVVMSTFLLLINNGMETNQLPLPSPGPTDPLPCILNLSRYYALVIQLRT